LEVLFQISLLSVLYPKHPKTIFSFLIYTYKDFSGMRIRNWREYELSRVLLPPALRF
jgi:hypothetical protein